MVLSTIDKEFMRYTIHTWIRRILGTIIYFIQTVLGLRPKGMRILCYHSVNEVSMGYLTVMVENFKQQMKYLASKGYKTVTLSEYLMASVPFDKKTIIITFDDGYEDNYRFAFPIMKEYNFKGTIFCCVNAILKERTTPAVFDYTQGDSFLTLEQVRVMSDYGFEFGSHAVTHPHLPQITRREKHDEIFRSKIELEKAIRRPVEIFCYPFGEYDNESIELLKEAGYLGACSNRPGANKFSSRSKNQYRLKRTEIGVTDTFFEFEKKLAGAYDILYKILHYVRGRP